MFLKDQFKQQANGMKVECYRKRLLLLSKENKMDIFKVVLLKGFNSSARNTVCICRNKTLLPVPAKNLYRTSIFGLHDGM